MLFKVDFKKSYDSVSWDFLDYMMMRMGFVNTWRKWLKECLSFARVSVLVNGIPTKVFSVGRDGFRQVYRMEASNKNTTNKLPRSNTGSG